MSKRVVTKEEILAVLWEVGVRERQTLMVHTSLGKLGYVCGGAQSVVEALVEFAVTWMEANRC